MSQNDLTFQGELAPARRPWSQPTVEKLSVALDTAVSPGSNIDGNSGSMSV